MKDLKETIISLLEQKFEEADFSNCFFVDLKQSKRKLQVFVDSDTGIDFQICRRLSRYLEEYLDGSQIMGTDYILEVSSPGVDTPIKLLRQLPKHIGRKIKIRPLNQEEQEFTGTLESINGEELSVQIHKKKKDPDLKIINFNDIEESKILISF